MARAQPLPVSFLNLIEAHLLRALRSPELRTHAGQVFLDRYVERINLSASGQPALRKVFEEHVKRVEWEEWKFPVRLYPYVDGGKRSAEWAIAVDPQVAFGRPVVLRTGISTAAIAERIDAGESVEAPAEDYDLTRDGIEQAVLYSRAA